MNPTPPHGHMTLRSIRDQRPCADGWTKLLASLDGASTPLDTVVSLGDVARSNGAADAWWCVQALDWTDIAVRRAVVRVLLLAVRRASVHASDHRVHDCIAALDAWVAGDDTVDLDAAADAADAAGAAQGAGAADAAAWAAARGATWAAWAARGAWDAVVAWGVLRTTRATETERETQRAELIAAFPPLHEVRL